jgi:hypothetical protein
MLLPRHCATRLTWCRRYLRFRIQDWANILCTDESRFHLESSDDRSRVYRLHPKHAQWVKIRMKLLDMVTNQHLAVSDSPVLLAKHVVERSPAEM